MTAKVMNFPACWFESNFCVKILASFSTTKLCSIEFYVVLNLNYCDKSSKPNMYLLLTKHAFATIEKIGKAIRQ